MASGNKEIQMNSKRNLAKTEILKLLRENRSTLKEYKVKKIGLFGSYAAGTQNSKSDIDFVVEFEEPTYRNFLGLIDYLEKLFKRKIEVLTPDGVETIRIKEVKEEIKRTVVYA